MEIAVIQLTVHLPDQASSIGKFASGNSHKVGVLRIWSYIPARINTDIEQNYWYSPVTNKNNKMIIRFCEVF